MKWIFIIFISCFLQFTFGQNKVPKKINQTSSETISTVEIDAVFPGGIELFNKYVSRNLQLPELPENLRGEIIMSYTIGTDGFITDVKLVKNNLGKLGEEISIDAIRVLKSSPKWNPASKNGQAIKRTNLIPIVINNI